jgi:hypothetical protein
LGYINHFIPTDYPFIRFINFSSAACLLHSPIINGYWKNYYALKKMEGTNSLITPVSITGDR